LSFAARLHTAALAAEQPVGALFELTYRCNWRCTFCYNPRRSDLAPLSTAEWIELLPALREAGALALTLSGGEPLAHPGCLAIARAARGLGMMVTLFTNGSLVDDGAAREIAEAGVFVVEISLHGATAATHEALTRTPGSFDAVLGAVARLQDAQVRVMLKTVLTRMNENEIDAMRALAEVLGVPFSLDPTVIPNDSGDLGPLELTASDDARRRELRAAYARREISPRNRQSGDANCALGRTSLRIDPEGDVYPCPRWMTPIGNVRATSLASLWRTPERKAVAALADESNERLLGEGRELASFTFCPALAAAAGPDPLVPSEGQRRLATLAAEAWNEVGAG
jgi:MoaA/NifB/PqqE/SkfB family radical SAM enzyme